MPEQPDRTRGRGRRRRAIGLGVGLFFCGWLVWSLSTFAVPNRVYMVPTGSMSPTIQPGDRVGVTVEPEVGAEPWGDLGVPDAPEVEADARTRQ